MDKLKYFYGSFVITLMGLIGSVFIDPDHIIHTLYIVVILALLEISLSFDNAVVNARTLAQMPLIWKKLFIWIGIPIAVFGMRLVFPILLVSLTTHMELMKVFHIALYDPATYHHALESGMPLICAFGGGFLLMVFFSFFLNETHETTWFGVLENRKIMHQMQTVPGMAVWMGIGVGLVMTLITYLSDWSVMKITMAFFAGLLIHEGIRLLNYLIGHQQGQVDVARNGLMGFLYLEILDASFSFDGVIGAFAISTNILIIMIGLGIGAMYVRSLTILFVEHQTLAKYRYLEHGAHYAIGFLALILLVKVFLEVPEWLTGTVSVGVILLAFVHSIRANRA